MLLHVIEKIRATQNDFRNSPLAARNRIPGTVWHTMVTRLHERLQHEQLEDKQFRRNPKPNVQSVTILCKTSQVGKEENRVKTALGGACAALGAEFWPAWTG
jgi:hypothetical protein